ADLGEVDAQPRPDGPAMLEDVIDGALDGVHGDGEPDALSVRNDGGIHPNDVAVDVAEGTAGVSRVDRGVGLDEVFQRDAGGSVELAIDSADDADGHRALEVPEGIADGDGRGADGEVVGI